jgi:hypothetical protein
MLNKRHKAIGFVTIVVTGTALLAGARLNQALGMLMLGAGLAWLIGSGTVSRTYHSLRGAPGKTWPWLRVLLLMVLGGVLLEAVAVSSHFNSFLAMIAMSAFGILISPVRQLPTHKGSLRAAFWAVVVTVFFLAVMGASILGGLKDQETERMGRLVVSGLIALAAGIFWLSKGRELVAAGISPKLLTETEQAETVHSQRSTKWVYLSLFIGVLIVALLLGVGLFSAFRDSAFPPATKAPTDQTNFRDIIFLLLLAWWPYSSWKTILRREPNTKVSNVMRHKRVAIALGSLFAIVVCLAITFGIQDGNDRMTVAQMEEGMKDFQAVAAKIASIKSRDLRTARDYIDAYGEMEPLLADFDNRLRHFDEIFVETERSVKNRGPLNIERFYGHGEKEWQAWDVKMLDVLRQDSALTKKQIDAINQMGKIPGEYQAQFFEKKVEPLLEEEKGLRRQWASLQASKPSSGQ